MQSQQVASEQGLAQGQAVLSIQAGNAEHHGAGAQLVHGVGGTAAQVIVDPVVVEPHEAVELHGNGDQ